MEFGGDGHWPVARGARAAVFRDCWATDVAPVHERTELSRRLRAEYAQLALKALMALNGGALVAVPALAVWIGIPLGLHAATLRGALGLFFAGLVAAVLAAMIGYVTLDIDVVRQKAERSAARTRIVETEFPDSYSADMAALFARTLAHEHRFWRLGVGLAWIAAALLVVALLCFVAGGVVAAALLD